MKIGISTNNELKVRALKSALNELSMSNAEIVQIPESSGISKQPKSFEEGIKGAMNRAKAALMKTNADIGVGIEGTIHSNAYGTFLCAIVAIITKDGKIRIASTENILMPAILLRALEKAEELGLVIDEFAKEKEVKKKQGTFGVLTGNKLTREETIKHALIAAFSSLNCELYEKN